MNFVTEAFKAMTAATTRNDRDAATAAAVVVGNTCLQVCSLPATTWGEAKDKARFLSTMLPWAWPREPALGAVLDAARRAESAIWGDG